jgi:glycosyltransferase involved in cell wall biosynthesis
MRSATSAQTIRLTACLIVKDEEGRLPECLSSVAFCDEVIVVDSGSTDRTVEIARAAGATVLERGWSGFAAQRNIALDASHGVWVLEVDADERVTPRLRDEILALVAAAPPEVDNAAVPVREVLYGERLGPSALYPGCRTRLFRRDCYRHDPRRTVHEGIWPAGQSAYPTGDLEHILATSLRESLRDLRSYAWLESTQLPDVKPVRAIVVGIAIRPAAKFVYRTWLLGGWKDGFAGLAKILLDCVYDSLTWFHYVRASRRPANAQRSSASNGSTCGAPTDDAGHFGRNSEYTGPVRIAAVAHGERRTAAADAWLEAAAREGADVVLITDAAPSPSHVRTIEIEGTGPLAVLRTIAWEERRNPIEALVFPSWVGRASSWLLPSHLRGGIPAMSLRANPRELISDALHRRPKAD